MEKHRDVGIQKKEKTLQKVNLPTFNKRGIQEAKQWLRRFTQYIKMAQNIDLNEMTTDRKKLQYRDDIEHRTKDLFTRALRETAKMEMARVDRDNDLNTKDINQLYSMFRLHLSRNEISSTVGQFS